ncbi:2-hydroxyacid dehydrogenase [Azospirillum rugosum]|uniref:Lactate dehydrogenase-like 2-hydroxyacid dehydrogenase n=1 Tax=Azospirillum rugosum TaxID=416170 RepID=A0ABS4SSP0_9PROT|nr:D-glycerate dehydrogenase [Azospirillum rugosum]MBP2294967.1 lactate dehydrogenase-like 2-hydroxyacid dehydrogenase [Azospirillum rugosum]MDQ0530983.1 lactate dehydrogenase-like 2-hydroxyacid dehydrogenase [Azospirillum rugosum]
MTSDHKPRVILLAAVPPDLRAAIDASCEVVAAPGAALPPGTDLAELLKGVRGALTTIRAGIDDPLLARCPDLKVVSNVAVGYDNIDVPAATRRGVLVCNTPGVLDAAVADLTMVMLLSLGRGALDADRFVRSGGWNAGAFPLTRDIAGKTLGIVGLGRIGRMVARRARAFDMDVVYYKPNRDTGAEAEGLATYCNRDELFQRADFVSLHLPFTEATRRGVGAREFALMKPTAYFINTARGSVVDEAALIEALKAKTIAGAALDVMEKEPIGADHPLCGLPNVMLLPHIGSATVETRRAMMELAVKNLIAAACGDRAPAMVNPEVLDR